MIDSHCHLADAKFIDDLPQVIARAKEAGVDRMVVIGDTIPESRQCVVLAMMYPELFATVGVHPHAAKDWKEGDGGVLTALAQSSPRVRAIGEIGLDFHYNFSPPDVQKAVFRTQLEVAKELGLPAVVHCREAVSELKAIIDEVGHYRLVVHCCTEKWEDVAPLVENGCMLSFTGIATYKNADVIRNCIYACPLEKLMIETDSPYLAPVPHRGKRNEPAFVAEVAKLIAELKGLGVPEVDAVTTANAERFFAL